MNIEEMYTKLNNPKNYKFEKIKCYQCGADNTSDFLIGEEDLTAKEGQFNYVKCKECGLVYQNPRIHVDQIKDFYDSEYIAHRKKKDWGVLTPLYEWAMNKHDRDKEKIIKRYVKLNKDSRVLDIGCAVGTFLQYLRKKYHCFISGVDFKEDLEYPDFDKIDFHCGLFYEQENLQENSYDLITMWHFLEHDYDPKKTLAKAKTLVKDSGRIIIEVPRLDSVTFKLFKEKWPGVQAPQHTIMFDKEHFIKICESEGLVVEKYLPYGAFPSYFYIFAGAYFKTIGKGLDLDKIVAPYFLGQFIMSPILFFEKKLNLSMQTLVLKRP